MKRVHLFITGDVIGVGFRSFIVRNAGKLSLTGWVKNVFTPEEGVEAVLEGEKKNIEEMIKICKKGPEVSWVENVKVDWQEATEEFVNFSIIK